ncbi:hypothetical protein OIU77_021389 [Salix suchowensis]|uniref:Uncharacterized protein n=1 Tax=Salix suchowensis TaxID=1278906 RepID=A0ABQ9C9Q2_9ROSI|nr:hypothetical protein OIU77_021389 [Salix suchowensis]
MIRFFLDSKKYSSKMICNIVQYRFFYLYLQLSRGIFTAKETINCSAAAITVFGRLVTEPASYIFSSKITKLPELPSFNFTVSEGILTL